MIPMSTSNPKTKKAFKLSVSLSDIIKITTIMIISMAGKIVCDTKAIQYEI